jgi:hypothetical protein
MPTFANKPDLVRLQVQIRRETHEALEQAALAEIVSVAVIVRRILDAYMVESHLSAQGGSSPNVTA